MKKKNNSILILLILFFAFLINGKIVNADVGTFEVSPVMPINQKKNVEGWFNVQVKPGEVQTFQINVKNLSSKEIKVKATPTNAMTAESGEIVYPTGKVKTDPSLKYQFPKLTQKPQIIKIPVGGTRLFTFTVKVPKESNNQLIMGGFNFKPVDDKPSKQVIQKDKKKKVQIKNYYSYNIASVLSVGKEPSPNLKITGVAPGLQNTFVAFGAQIQNDQPNYVSNMSVKAKVTRKDSKKVVAKRDQSNMSMAANSNFTYYMQVGDYRIVPGVYHLDLSAEGSGKKWKFSRDFEVSRKEANELNRANFLLPKSKLWLYILIGVVLLILVIAIVVFVYYRGQNKARERLEKSMKMAGQSQKPDTGLKDTTRKKIPRRRK